MSSDLTPHALAPGTQIRDYTIVSVIGTGGFSIVYRAIDNSLQREVAIKEYFPAAMALRASDGSIAPHGRDKATFSKGIESFLNEGKLLAAFDHPALVRVYRCWEERGTAYLAMRLYAGTTLRDAVTAGNWRTDVTSLPALLAPLCDALNVLHAAQCYHRDVAPDNIMLVDAGAHRIPVLLDFGAARKTIENTQVFTAILKPGYAPIEQYGDGELKQGPWTDIYALAGVLYFTLAGSAPPTAISRMIRDNMLRPRDAFVGRLPEHWLDAIEHALAVKPEMRPQTIAEFMALFDWSATTQRPTTFALPADQLERSVAQRSAVVSNVDGSAAVPSVLANREALALRPADDGGTVIAPRHKVDAPISEKMLESLPLDGAAAALKISPKPRGNGEPAKTRSALGVAAIAVFIAFAIAAAAWKLASRPAQSPTAPSPETTLAKPPIESANDASTNKKTSLPSEASPKPTSAIVAPVTTRTPTSPQKITVTELPASAESATKADVAATAKANAKEKAKAARAAAPNVIEGAGEASPPVRASRRPERCNALMERFQLGESLREADQRFLMESCK